MRELIAWLLVGVACVGLIYIVFLIITFAMLPREETIDLYCCDNCEECHR